VGTRIRHLILNSRGGIAIPSKNLNKCRGLPKTTIRSATKVVPLGQSLAPTDCDLQPNRSFGAFRIASFGAYALELWASEIANTDSRIQKIGLKWVSSLLD
jgi:hypothetical protein